MSDIHVWSRLFERYGQEVHAFDHRESTSAVASSPIVLRSDSHR